MATWPHSPRNERTGPGSRGGRGDNRPVDPAYWSRYRAEHPDYVERERRRRARRAVPLPIFSDACRALVVDEVSRSSIRAVARRLLVDNSSLGRWVRGLRTLPTETIDAIVDVYGLDRVRAARAELRRSRRADLRSGTSGE